MSDSTLSESTVKDTTVRSAGSQRPGKQDADPRPGLPRRTGWETAAISAAATIFAACIVTYGACSIARVFEPSFVQLDNVTFNMRHIVEIVDSRHGCQVVTSKDGSLLNTGVATSQVFSSHSLDLIGCLSLRRAMIPHTISGVGRITRGEVFLSGLAQASVITTTGRCPNDMTLFHGQFPNGETAALCQLTVDIAYRMNAGPPWPESWKATGVAMPFFSSECPDGLVHHGTTEDVLWCCFGLAEVADPHPGHSVQ